MYTGPMRFLLVLLLLLSGPAWAQTPVETVMGWAISIDKYGQCMMLRDFSDGTRMGVHPNPASRKFNLTLNNRRWQADVKSGHRYPIRFAMNGGGQNWTGEAMGVRNAYKNGVLVLGDVAKNFLYDFMGKAQVDIYNESTLLGRITPVGSEVALTALIRCQLDLDKPVEKPVEKPREPSLAPAPAYKATPVPQREFKF